MFAGIGRFFSHGGNANSDTNSNANANANASNGHTIQNDNYSPLLRRREIVLGVPAMEPEIDDESAAGPTVADARVVKAMLMRGFPLPLELVDAILDAAEYWPHSTTQVAHQGPAGLRELGDAFLFRTPPLGFEHPPSEDYTHSAPVPQSPDHPVPLDRLQHVLGPRAPVLAHPCRKIVFTLISRDQGWGGHPNASAPFRDSYTWFDVGLERYGEEVEEGDDAAAANTLPPTAALCSVLPPVADGKFSIPLLPSDHHLQRNQVARRIMRRYEITWAATDHIPYRADEAAPPLSFDEQEASDALDLGGRGRATGNGDFVRNLRLGDVVTLWAKARFPGWANHVRLARVDVYWAV